MGLPDRLPATAGLPAIEGAELQRGEMHQVRPGGAGCGASARCKRGRGLRQGGPPLGQAIQPLLVQIPGLLPFGQVQALFLAHLAQQPELSPGPVDAGQEM